jgi:transposase InsO family protein
VAIRTDNGLPFAVTQRPLQSVEAVRLVAEAGHIAIERIRPGHPQQNGRHERMHLTLKKEATRPPGRNILQQQARFDAFVSEFNCGAAA